MDREIQIGLDNFICSNLPDRSGRFYSNGPKRNE